jgi:NAD(P)H-dependent FMN reductase
LKNAIDWASRPGYGGGQVFQGKAAAMIGASPGAAGSGRAQLALRQSLVFLNMVPINQLSIFGFPFFFKKKKVIERFKFLFYYYILDLGLRLPMHIMLLKKMVV